MTLSLASDRRVPGGRIGDDRGVTVLDASAAQSPATGRCAVSASHRARSSRLAASVVREAERLALEGSDAVDGVTALLAAAEGQNEALARALVACTDAVGRYPGSVAARRSVQLLHAAIEVAGLDLGIAG